MENLPEELLVTVRFEDDNFVGHEPRWCGEHRTVGNHRAWCFDCFEWCYPAIPCLGCDPRIQEQ